MDGRRVPDVVVGRGDVEVSPDHKVAAGRAGVADPATEALEPGQLAGVERRVHDSAVGRVDADYTEAVDGGGNHPRLVERVEVVLSGCLGTGAARPRIAHRTVTEVG